VLRGIPGRLPTGDHLADQLSINSFMRSSARAKLSADAAKPRRKCEGTSKQSPGANRIPRPVAAWQKGRASSRLRTTGRPYSALRADPARTSAMRSHEAIQ